MHKRNWILASATALVVAITTTWAATGRRPAARGQQVSDGFVVTKSGLMPDASTPYYTGISPETREETRQKMSGWTINTDPHFLCKDVDPVSAEALALLFRSQQPIPPDRVQHFAWIDKAKDDLALLGWAASIRSAERQGDDWLLELMVKPVLETETSVNGIVYDHYLETYVVHDGFFEYTGGRSPDIVRHAVQPDPGLPTILSFD